jgi:hypothetical protein
MWPTPTSGDMPGDLGVTAQPHRPGQYGASPQPAASMQAGPVQTGPVQTGAVHRGAAQAGAVQTGAVQAGAVQTGGSEPAAEVTGPHRPRVGRRRKERADEVPGSEGKSKLLPVVAGVAVVAVIVAIVLVLLPSGPDDDETAVARPDATTAAATSSAGASDAPSERPLSAVRVPEGYRQVTEGGVSLAVPEEWSATVEDGTVRLTGPKDSGQSITIKRIPDGGLTALRAAEQNLDIKDFTDYTQIQLRQVDYRYPAADWEYTYTNTSEVTVHAVIRYLETTGGRAYAIMFASPDFDWNESAAPVRQALWSTFRPA